MQIVICVGSSCYLKGSKAVIERLGELIEKNGCANEVELVGAFCMGRCMQGVCVMIGEAHFSLSPQTTEAFFENEVLGRLQKV